MAASPPLELGIVPIDMDEVRELYEALDRPMFTGPYNLNLWAIRERERVDDWNDVIGCAWQDARREWHIEAWQATTDPGAYYLQAPMRAAGTAILAPGWHPRAWQAGLHKGAYPCLVQAGPLRVYRDANLDAHLDYVGQATPSMSALQIHHGGGSLRVGKWSAGCQVIRWPAALARLMALVRRQVEAGHGSTVSYALFEEMP